MTNTTPPRSLISSPLDLIGDTSVVKLAHGAAGAGEVWCKCEQYNPGGSIKDRIALAMIDAAEAAGQIKPGVSTIVEPTSGNTGIGLALVCAARGYQLILTMPESMSLERRQLLSSYGAKLVLTPEERVMEGAVTAAQELVSKHENHVILDQFRNPANPNVHKTTTGPELLRQLEGVGELHAFVAGVGTGGTISGVGAVLRERFPSIQIVAVEPSTSRVLSGGKPGPHKIQGIGAGFVPGNFDRSVVTDIRHVDDQSAYETAKRLAKTEGLLVGISSGANVFIANQLAQELGPKARIATILCDTGERYFSMETYFS